MVTSLSSSTANYNPNKDIEVVQPPSDSISDLAFSPLANFLAASSWDNQVNILREVEVILSEYPWNQATLFPLSYI